MIGKEKRAYLQELLDGHSNGHPRWQTFGDDETDIGRVRGHQSIRGFHGDTLGSFYNAGLARLATEAVNALGELIDDLNASEGNADLEKLRAENRELKAEIARLKSPTEFDLWRHGMDQKVRDLQARQHTQILLLSEYGERLREVHAAYAREFEKVEARIAQLENERSGK